jgi:hypothetical protein
MLCEDLDGVRGELEMSEVQGALVNQSLPRWLAEKDAEILRLRAQVERLESEHRSTEAQLRAEYEQSIAALTRRCDNGWVALRRNLDAQGDGLAKLVHRPKDRLRTLQAGANQGMIDDADRRVDEAISRAELVVQGRKADADAAVAARKAAQRALRQERRDHAGIKRKRSTAICCSGGPRCFAAALRAAIC